MFVVLASLVVFLRVNSFLNLRTNAVDAGGGVFDGDVALSCHLADDLDAGNGTFEHLFDVPHALRGDVFQCHGFEPGIEPGVGG